MSDPTRTGSPVPRRTGTPAPKRWLTGGGAGSAGAAPARATAPKRPRSPRSGDPLTFLVRAMVYEVWVVGVTGVAVSLLLFVALGSGLTDVYLQVRGVGEPSGRVAQVTIGEEALYLWDPAEREPETTSRPMLAEIVRFLHRAGADVIVLDILLDRPEDGDDQLAEAARAHGAVIAAERYVLTEPASGTLFQPAVVAVYDGSIAGGFANLYQRTTILSQDMLVRGAPLVKRVTRARLDGRWPHNLVGGVQEDGAIVPSMALAAAWTHQRHREGLSARLVELEQRLASACTPTGALACAIDLPQLGLPDADGGLADVLTINFRAPEHSDPLPTVRAADILRIAGASALLREFDPSAELEVPAAYRDVLAGRVVVVGRAGLGETGDRFITPFGFPAYLEADMAGLRIQAQVIDTLLSGRHVRTIRAPMWALALLCVGGVYTSFRRVSDRVHFTAWSAACVGMVLAGAAFFRWTDGWMFDTSPAVAGILGTLLVTHVVAWAREAMGER